MKKILIFTFCLFTLLNYSQTKKLIGFGNAKIGMSISEFNKIFGTKINNSNQWIGTYSKTLNVTDELSIEDVNYYFNNKKLVLIKCKYNQQLYNGLVKIYGIDYIKTTSKHKTFFKLKNTSKNIICIGIKNNEILIYDKLEKPSKKTFRSIDFEKESIKELNIIEGYKGV